MTAGPTTPWCRVAWIVWFMVSVVWPASAVADGQRRVVLYAPPAELLSRLRGQTADLDWHVLVVDEPAPTEEPLHVALQAGRSRGAALVVWFEAVPEGGWYVYSVDVEREDLLARRVELVESSDALAVSAANEAAALVLRSILSSMSQGGRIGVVSQSQEGLHPQPSTAPSEPTERPANHRTEPEVAVSAAERSLAIRAGWQLGMDSPDLKVRQGPEVGLGIVVAHWQIGVFGSYGVPRLLEDTFTQIRLARAAGGARVVRSVWRQGPLALEAALAVAAVAYRRETTAQAPWAVPTPDNYTWSPLLGVDIGFDAVPFNAAPLHFLATFGVDVVPRPPVLQYEIAGEAFERGRISPAQPRLSLYLEFRPHIF